VIEMMFFGVLAALIGVVGTLLWFTGWAEERIIAPEAQPLEAKPR
jgi:hypothetical protein